MPWQRKPSRVEVRDGLIIVYANNTGRGHIFDFSEGLLEVLNSCAWNENSGGYLSGRVNKDRTFGHWLVLPKHPDLRVDHINGCRWDNRETNLRYLSNGENTFNRKTPAAAQSGYRGVYWHKKGHKWAACIRFNYHNLSLGLYDDINDAICARKAAEQRYFPTASAEGALVQ